MNWIPGSTVSKWPFDWLPSASLWERTLLSERKDERTQRRTRNQQQQQQQRLLSVKKWKRCSFCFHQQADHGTNLRKSVVGSFHSYVNYAKFAKDSMLELSRIFFSRVWSQIHGKLRGPNRDTILLFNQSIAPHANQTIFLFPSPNLSFPGSWRMLAIPILPRVSSECRLSSTSMLVLYISKELFVV